MPLPWCHNAINDVVKLHVSYRYEDAIRVRYCWDGVTTFMTADRNQHRLIRYRQTIVSYVGWRPKWRSNGIEVWRANFESVLVVEMGTFQASLISQHAIFVRISAIKLSETFVAIDLSIIIANSCCAFDWPKHEPMIAANEWNAQNGISSIYMATL